jgi:hypothetical protein
MYGVKRKTLRSVLENAKVTQKLANKLKHTRLHTKVEVLHKDCRLDVDNMSAVMDDVRNMIYQHDLDVKPLWTREELNK